MEILYELVVILWELGERTCAGMSNGVQDQEKPKWHWVKTDCLRMLRKVQFRID